ncbi:MAG: DJ-1/PfpI family protein [Candidatus Hadarchaeaceae archaeon]
MVITLAKKVLLIIAPENYRDEELFHTREELERAGVAITVASSKKGELQGMLGAKVTPDIVLDQVRVVDYDGIVFVGGSGSAVYFKDNKALLIAAEAFKKGKVVGAICIAPVILANAGVLKYKKATVFPGDYVQKITDGGAIYQEKPVVVDGKVVTANGPSSAREFGRAIAKLLMG